MKIAIPQAAPDVPVDAAAGIDSADELAQSWIDGGSAPPLDRIALGPRAAALLAARRASPPMLIAKAATDDHQTIAVGARKLNLSEGLYSLE